MCPTHEFESAVRLEPNRANGRSGRMKGEAAQPLGDFISRRAYMVSGIFGTQKVGNHCEPTANVGEKPECMSEVIIVLEMDFLFRPL